LSGLNSDRSLYGAGGRPAQERTSTTIQRVLGNIRAYNALPAGQAIFAGGFEANAFRGLTQADIEMIRHRYPTLNGLNGSGQHEAIMSMTRDARILADQLRNPFVGPLAPAEISGGLGIRAISKNAGLPPVGPGKADEKAVEEARKKYLENLKDQYNLAQKQFDILIGQEGQKANPNYESKEIVAAAIKADNLRKQVAKAENDNATLMGLNAQYEGAIVKRKEESLKAREEAEKAEQEAWQNAHDASEAMMKARVETAKTDYEIAVKKHGALSPQAIAAARAADIAERAAASPGELRSIIGGVSGTAQQQKDALKELIPGLAEAFGIGIPNAAAISDQYGRNTVETARDRLAAIQRGARGNNIFTDQNAAEGSRLQQNIGVIQAAVDALSKITAPTQENIEQLKQMRDQLADANAALVDFKDRVAAEAYQKRVQAEADTYQLRNEEISHLHRLKFNKDEDAAQADGVRKYRELLKSAEQNLATVKGRPLTNNTPDEIRRAAKEVASAHQELTDYQIETKLQKYQNAYGGAKATVHDALSDFFHGRGDAGTAIERIGGSIVDAGLDSFIKQYADPLVQTVTNEILAIQGNTDALGALTDTLNGGGGAGGGGGSGSGGSVAGKSRGPSDLQRGIGGALAAYSIGANSASQGVNIGNLLGSAVSGFAIGGPIGAGIGIAADLIGGLFHHKDKPTATPQDLNPALYNAPNNFDIGAYNYTMSGILPRLQNVGFDVKPTNAPIVNVYVDGAKVAARQEISSQTSLSRVSLDNHGGNYGMTPV
jgi:hypothetical protein